MGQNGTGDFVGQGIGGGGGCCATEAGSAGGGGGSGFYSGLALSGFFQVGGGQQFDGRVVVRTP